MSNLHKILRADGKPCLFFGLASRSDPGSAIYIISRRVIFWIYFATWKHPHTAKSDF